ncbi:hypothetical protein TNCV_3507291 [Trichonephila clavipes]|uniref:Uncharacterized protein n=1 Tax=Trichonephila clavipes TaxID=2585209 RepID=A0A8X6RXD7_TRICX|nr:hypothetical protein TNCV_3507291 [Trichonephila clavipes]
MQKASDKPTTPSIRHNHHNLVFMDCFPNGLPYNGLLPTHPTAITVTSSYYNSSQRLSLKHSGYYGMFSRFITVIQWLLRYIPMTITVAQ